MPDFTSPLGACPEVCRPIGDGFCWPPDDTADHSSQSFSTSVPRCEPSASSAQATKTKRARSGEAFAPGSGRTPRRQGDGTVPPDRSTSLPGTSLWAGMGSSHTIRALTGPIGSPILCSNRTPEWGLAPSGAVKNPPRGPLRLTRNTQTPVYLPDHLIHAPTQCPWSEAGRRLAALCSHPTLTATNKRSRTQQTHPTRTHMHPGVSVFGRALRPTDGTRRSDDPAGGINPTPDLVVPLWTLSGCCRPLGGRPLLA